MKTKNPSADKTREILKAKGFQRIAEIMPPKNDGLTYHWQVIESWASDRGMVLLQEWKDGHGCATFANSPLRK